MPKTPVNDINNPILLLLRHFVVARQAETAAEDVGTDVDAFSRNVGVAACATVAQGRDERVGTIDRLHVHRFPDRTTFRIEGGKRIENLLRAALSGDGLV